MTEGDVLKLYRKEVFGIIDEIYDTEVKKDKIVYVFGPGGHSNLAAMEVFFRAGGLMHINAILNQETMLSNGALKSMATERLPGYGKIVIEDNGIGEGDLLIVVNAYGINSATIDACLTAQSRGAKVIGVSSHIHANSCPKDHPARHPSKKNLHEIADCSVDCKIKLGDATIELPGFEQKIGALSTYANAFVMNGIIIEAINMLVNEGVNPPVWRSGNCPGGDEWNNRFIAKFRKSIRSL